MLAMTIFALMGIMILTVYFNSIDASRRLNAARQLSETAREITERISQDVRENWISISGSSFDDHVIGNDLWKNPQYTGSGGEILGIWPETSPTHRYIYGKKIRVGSRDTIDHCTETDKKNIKVHCWLYVVEWDRWSEGYNLVDSFIPEEEKKRVKIEHLRFYISGSEKEEKKVMINFILSIMPRIGVPIAIGQTKLHVQTTISERIFKTY